LKLSEVKEVVEQQKDSLIKFRVKVTSNEDRVLHFKNSEIILIVHYLDGHSIGHDDKVASEQFPAKTLDINKFVYLYRIKADDDVWQLEK